jgi:uncharacterized protein (TIGR02145 family)
MRNLLFLLTSILTLISCSNDGSSSQNVQNEESHGSLRLTPLIPIDNIQIGTQIWMTKNLNGCRYRNGDLIPEVQNPDEFTHLTTGAWCYYGNNPANGQLYGKLYNWYAVNDPRGLAPVGWHIPSVDEWNVLVNFLGTDAAKKLRATVLWEYTNINASGTNSSGFTCLPGGSRFVDIVSVDYYLREQSNFWTSTSNNNGTQNGYEAWGRSLYNENNYVWPDVFWKGDGLSIRCVKD